MKYVLLIPLMFIAVVMSAQQDDNDFIEIGSTEPPQRETFFGSTSHHGVLFGVTAHYREIEKEDALVLGFKGAYVMDRSIEIGMAGQVFYAELDNFGPNNETIDVAGGYAGLHVAPSVMPLNKVHVQFPILLGFGGVGYDDNRGIRPGEFEFTDDHDEFFVGQIGANVIFNITNFFQIEIGAQYLKTTEVELENISNLDLDGFSGGFGLRFGRF